VTVTLNLTHSTPQDLTILLVDPSSRGVYLTYETTPSPSCNTSLTTSWADNQTAVMVKNGNVSLSSCPPSVVTPVEGVYSFGPVVGVDYGITTGSAVFATVYAGATTNGRWELMISSTGGSGTLYSNFIVSIFPPCFASIYVLILTTFRHSPSRLCRQSLQY